jgi:hypothetical protein
VPDCNRNLEQLGLYLAVAVGAQEHAALGLLDQARPASVLIGLRNHESLRCRIEMMKGQRAEAAVVTADLAPASSHFDQPLLSTDDGRTERAAGIAALASVAAPVVVPIDAAALLAGAIFGERMYDRSWGGGRSVGSTGNFGHVLSVQANAPG